MKVLFWSFFGDLNWKSYFRSPRTPRSRSPRSPRSPRSRSHSPCSAHSASPGSPQSQASEVSRQESCHSRQSRVSRVTGKTSRSRSVSPSTPRIGNNCISPPLYPRNYHFSGPDPPPRQFSGPEPPPRQYPPLPQTEVNRYSHWFVGKTSKSTTLLT